MTEEEKNAIEIVKGLAVYYDDYSLLDEEEIKENESVNKSIELILNLIEKLQKENEELKADNYELNNRITDLLENIPIQKVKDKIEEYKNMLKTCNKAKDIDRIKAINERILELQELIEEER